MRILKFNFCRRSYRIILSEVSRDIMQYKKAVFSLIGNVRNFDRFYIQGIV